MRGFKDFFHETNDIALAIVIVLLAAGLIGWRIRIIPQRNNPYTLEVLKC